MSTDNVDRLNEHKVIGGRLREAREYLGLLQEEVADALSIPRASVSALEAGKRRVSGVELRRLARLYRRPVGWLLGEEETPVDPQGVLYRTAASLSATDKEQVLRFAQFLAAAGEPGPGRGGRSTGAQSAAVETGSGSAESP